MVQKKTTLQDDQDIIKKYLNGTAPKILQNQYNISKSTFGKILKDNNIQPIQAKRYTLEEKLSIAESYKNGKSAKMVAEEFNIAESNVLKICRAFNVDIRKQNDRVSESLLSKNEINEIIKLYQNGFSPKEIGEKYDIWNNSVTRILKNNNIPRNQTKKVNEVDINYMIKSYQDGYSSEIIAKELNISPTTVCRNLIKNNVKITEQKYNHRKHKIDYNWLDSIDTEEKAYFLGLMWSDGNVSERDNAISIRLLNTDSDILEKISHIIYGFNNLQYEKDGTFKMARLVINSIDFKNKLAEYGCFPNKTKSIMYPIFLTSDLNKHFIRGLIDGDGSICYNGRVSACLSGNFNIVNSTKNIILKEINNPNMKINLSKKKNTDTFNITIYRQKNILLFFNWLYSDATIFMNRKYFRFLFLLDRLKKEKLTKKTSTKIILNKKDILIMNEAEKEKAAILSFNKIRENSFPFPNYPKCELNKDWYNLVKINTNNLLINNIINNSNDIKCGNKLWKQFSEHFYIASDGKKPSLFEAFYNDLLLKKAINNRLGITYKETFSITIKSIIQAFKVAHIASSISVFKPTIAKLIYDKYTNKNDIVYDFSMGFGQRLLGAMSCSNNLTYIGVDPWKDVVPALKKLSKFIKKSNNCELYRNVAEKFCPNHLHGKINLAFSSPPYFDIEVYDKHRSQANFGKTYDQFINEWWLNVAKNIYTLLTKNGKLALNMKQNILKDMNTVLLNNGFRYIETLYIRSSRKHMNEDFVDEPIAIYEKI